MHVRGFVYMYVQAHRPGYSLRVTSQQASAAHWADWAGSARAPPVSTSPAMDSYIGAEGLSSGPTVWVAMALLTKPANCSALHTISSYTTPASSLLPCSSTSLRTWLSRLSCIHSHPLCCANMPDKTNLREEGRAYVGSQSEDVLTWKERQQERDTAGRTLSWVREQRSWSSAGDLPHFPSFSVPDLSPLDVAFHNQGGSFLLSYTENTLTWHAQRWLLRGSKSIEVYSPGSLPEKPSLSWGLRNSDRWDPVAASSARPHLRTGKESLGNCIGALQHCLGPEVTHGTSVHNLLVRN